MRSSTPFVLLAFAISLFPRDVVAGGPPPTVSPGGLDRATEVAGACPTFSWGAIPDAARFELLVLEERSEEEPAIARRKLVAGSAASWTPDRADCLLPGRAYAWSVRAFDAEGEPIGGEEAWAALRRFTVPALPSDAEVAAAVEVIRRWQAARGAEAESVETTGAARAGSRTAASSGEAVQVSGTSAIRGENPTGTGPSHGVWGQTASPEGGGLVAVNLAGGPDLLLDGEAQGGADARITESGIDRPSATAQSFAIGNSGGGGMTLLVEGNPVWHAGNVGPGSGLEADTLDGLHAGGLAPAAHDHFGQTWSGDSLDGLVLETSDPEGTALRGMATAESGNSYGLRGESSSAQGIGVFGWASAVSGYTIGVKGVNSSNQGSGIEGWGQATGVSGFASSTDGRAVFGFATASSGATYGVWGSSMSPTGVGTLGQSDVAGGVGLLGRNVEGGTDLMLDGNPPAKLTESGLTRESPGGTTFEFSNPGAGAMTLRVDGVDVLTTATGGDITAVAATGGLAGGGLSGDVTVQVAPLGITNALLSANAVDGGKVLDESLTAADLAPDSVGASEIAAGAVGAAEVNAGEVQLRVAGLCGSGQIIQGVNADGSVVCYEVPVPPRITTVDSVSGNVGQYTSLAIGSDGFPVISYYNTVGDDLLVVKCHDAACADGDRTLSIVASAGDVGTYNSLAIGTDGFPVISFYSQGVGLLVAKCNDSACSGGDETISQVDGLPSAGKYSSIAIGIDGFPVVSYYYEISPFDTALKVAKCNDPACAGGDETGTIVDNADWAGEYTSIDIGSDGFPVISYHSRYWESLKVAKCNDAACAGGDETITTVDTEVISGHFNSLAIGSDGLPVISYWNSGRSVLKVAKCNDPACAGDDETITDVDVPHWTHVGSFTSLAIGSDEYPVISYRDVTNTALKVAKCNDPACSGGDEMLTTVDSAGDVGAYTSIAIGTDGFPVIGYYDITNGDLKVAKCWNPSCRF